ncbi:Uncharacterised protein [Vibrio cholerae]|nr:Uncharacterised protein [Vibrio cholerae]
MNQHPEATFHIERDIENHHAPILLRRFRG